MRKNVKDSDDKGGEVDLAGGEDPVGAPVPGGPVDDTTKKNKKAKVGLPWEPSSFFNQEVPERDDEEDEEEEEMNYITLQRLRKADERTKAMTREEYVTWSEYRQASFTYRKGKRFREWAGFGIVTDSKPSDDIVDILGFLTFEMVQTLTEEALKIKEQEDLWKERTGGESAGNKKRKLAQSLFDPPSEGRTPVEPRHIQEAFRRLQSRPKKSRAMLGGTRLQQKTNLKLVSRGGHLREAAYWLTPYIVLAANNWLTLTLPALVRPCLSGQGRRLARYPGRLVDTGRSNVLGPGQSTGCILAL